MIVAALHAKTISHGPGAINVDVPSILLICRAMAGQTLDELTTRVFEILRDDILDGAATFTPRSNLVDSGLDSLAVTQLLLSIEESTGVWVDEGLLTPENLESAASLASLVYEQLQGA